MRRLGIIVGIFVVLLGAAVAAAWVALQSIDWNDYKEPIAQAAYDATGRRLDLAGDLKLRIGWTPSVRLEGVGFENAAWGSREQMATVEQLMVRLELMPLFSNEVVVDRIDLIGLDLALETNESGVSNWEFESVASTDVPAGSEPPDSGAGEGGDGATEDALSTLLRRARVRNAKILIRNERSGSEQRILVDRLEAVTVGGDDVRLELEASYNGSPIELQGDFTGIYELQDGAPLGLALELAAGGAKGNLQGSIEQPLEGQGLDLEVELAGESLNGFDVLAGTELPDLGPYRVAMKLGGGGDRYAIDGLDLQVAESNLTGNLNIDLSRARPRIDGQLESAMLDLADFEDPATTSAPSSTAGGSSPPAVSSGSSGRVFSADPIALDGLEAADADLTLNAAVIRDGDLTYEGTDLHLKLRDRNLRISPLVTTVSGTRVSASISLDASQPRPPLAVKGEVRGLVLGDWLRRSGDESLTDGPLDLDFDLTGSGSSVREIMAGLNGVLGVRMGHAVLNNEWAGLAVSNVSNLVSTASAKRGSDINCLHADFNVSNGKARPDGFVVDLGSVALFGQGKIDLRDERIRLSFDRQAFGASASSALPPFKLKGTLAEPDASIDATAIAGHALDLTAKILGKGGNTASGPRPTSCTGLLASYRAAGGEAAVADSASDLGTKATNIVGEENVEKGKEVIDSIKGLFR